MWSILSQLLPVVLRVQDLKYGNVTLLEPKPTGVPVIASAGYHDVRDTV